MFFTTLIWFRNVYKISPCIKIRNKKARLVVIVGCLWSSHQPNLSTFRGWTCLQKFLAHKFKISKLMWVIFINLKEFLVFWNKLDFFLLQHTISLIYATFSLLFKTLIECQIEIVSLFHFELNYETSNSNSKIILLNLVCSTGQS